MIVSRLAPLVLVATSYAYESPQYHPYTRVLSSDSLFEQFNYPALQASPWVPSQSTKYDVGRGEEMSYKGRWAIEDAKEPIGFQNDKGLVMKSKAAHHAISRKLEKPFDNTNNDLVLQYELKVQDTMSCSGAYIKLLDVQQDYKNLSSATPYQVMFGPDKCGSENKVHFIIRRPNPHTGQYEEKHLRTPPMMKGGKLSALYTLIIRRNQDFEIRVNGQVAKAGNLVASPNLLRPSLNPPAEIVDITDEKPDDWDDRLTIPDPNSPKPVDYDLKHAWTTIPDLDAVKPDDWDESIPPYVADNSAKPDYWDDEEDGPWRAPQIPNPACANLAGCGPWSPPTIVNPHYIGPWIPPRIDNPNYQGEWQPRNIPNPEYYEDSRPSDLELIGGIGFDLWSMDSNLLFDNIYLGHSVAEAELIGNETWSVKQNLEFQYKEAHQENIKHAPLAPPPDIEELIANESVFSQVVDIVKVYVIKHLLDAKHFYDEFSQFPIETIIEHPVRFVVYCAVLVIIFSVAFGTWAVLVFLVSGPGPQQVKEEEVTGVVESKTTSVELHEGEVTKRK